MKGVVEVVAFDNLPVLACHLPLGTIPLLLDSLTILITTHAPVGTPRGTWLSKVMALLPKFPRTSLNTPMALHIAFNDALPITVVSDTLVSTPHRLDAAMLGMVVAVSTSNFPELLAYAPADTIPLALNSLSVTVSSDALVRTP